MEAPVAGAFCVSKGLISAGTPETWPRDEKGRTGNADHSPVQALYGGGDRVLRQLTAFGNITDYDTNWAVQHVLSMDTMIPTATIGYRAIHSPMWETAGYLTDRRRGPTAVPCWIRRGASPRRERRRHRLQPRARVCDLRTFPHPAGRLHWWRMVRHVDVAEITACPTPSASSSPSSWC